MSDQVKWPNGAKCAVMLTFDFDAETLWLSRDPANAKRPGTLSQGLYGAKRGVPKILELLREEEIPASFYVPGWVAENHTARVEEILADGHEVGHHGYLHEWVDPDFPDKEEEALEKGLEALWRCVGVKPLGYRSPAGETSANLIRLLSERGFLYDSTMMDDVFPYRHVLADGSPGPIELPWHWSMDDAVHALFSMKNPRAIFPNEHILSLWKAEFEEIYRWGGLVDVLTHPQVSGRPMRLALLRDFIHFTRQFPGVWYATGADIAAAWAAQENAQ